jgi:hypothetical protein
MNNNVEPLRTIGRGISLIAIHLSRKWEAVFFLLLYFLLFLQVRFLSHDIQSLSSVHGVIAGFALFESFARDRLHYFATPIFMLPLSFFILFAGTPRWARRYFDLLGIYVIIRMITQLIGLNILVFDAVTSRFLLITQLLFFLPYSLLIWGWTYWRLDSIGISNNRPLFRLDCEKMPPRPIDYFVASFSTVFSANIIAIKGNTARAKVLILGHGFLIYDIMGLTLSRAVALVQSR